jgi:hypothetical protein
MINNTNLSKLANVLNDGSDGQYLKSTGSGGVAFDDLPAGVTVYTGLSGTDGTPSGATYLLNASGSSAGDLAWVKDVSGSGAKKAMYVWDGSAWDKVASGSDESPVITTEPPTSAVEIASSGTTDVTMVAQDPEGFDISYGIAYKTANNAVPSQLNSAPSINQSTGVYTFTPSTTAGSFTARLSASDGVKATTRLVDFSLQFQSWTQVFSNSNISFANGITRSTSSSAVKAFSDQSFGGTETYRYWRFDITALRTSSNTDTAMLAIVLKKASGNNSVGYHSWAIGTSSTPPNQASSCKMWKTSDGSEITLSAYNKGGGSNGANNDYYFALVSDDYTPNSPYHKFYTGLPSGASGSAPNYSIIIDAGVQVAATHFNYYVADDSVGRDPKGFTIYGSNISADFD